MLHPLFDNKIAGWLEDRGFNFPPKLVVSFSGGKDSTSMVHRLLSWGFKIDALLFFDTDWEFPEMYQHLKEVEEKTGLKIIKVKPRKPFDELIKRYRWPDSRRRWCTREKIDGLNKWINQNYNKKQDYIIHCVGFAVDELTRTDSKEMLKKGQVMFPLLNNYSCDPKTAKDLWDRDLAMTEEQALKYCKDLGYTWGGLYENFSRVSCYCCPLKRKKDILILKNQYPALWQEALRKEKSIPESEKYITFRGKESLTQIDDRLAAVAANIGKIVETEPLELFPAA
jgi:3'-phosphoadenosine 5'-phosphosulfate sulfotransferase (PAPS reductase)/FAD synthetase